MVRSADLGAFPAVVAGLTAGYGRQRGRTTGQRAGCPVWNTSRVARLRRTVATTVGCCALAVIGFELLVQGPERADAVSSIVAAVLLCLSVLGVLGPGGAPAAAMPMADLVALLREEVLRVWRPEAARRWLLGVGLLPLRLAGQQGREDPVWSAERFQGAAAALVSAGPHRRVLIAGAAGSGKSTLALLMTLGLAQRDGLPILLPLTSWDPLRERFAAWSDRQLPVLYKGARLLPATGEPHVATLMHAAPEAVLILDGLDELPAASLREAVRDVDETVPADRTVVFLGRRLAASAAERAAGPATFLRIAPVTGPQVAAYLAARASERGEQERWRPVCDELTREPGGALAAALDSPFFVELARRGRLPETPGSGSTRTGGAREIRRLLMADHLAERLPDARTRAAAGFVAREMGRRGVDVLAWWRIHEIVPAWVVAAVAGLAVLPFFRMCLSLPNGLTRGFATGLAAALAFTLLRTVRSSPRAGAVAGAVAAPATALVGWSLLDWHDWVADAVQVSLAVGMTVWLKDAMLAGPLRAVPAVAGTGAACSAAIAGLQWLAPGLAPSKTWLSVFLSVAMGAALAVLATRSLAGPAPVEPCRIEFGVRRRPRRVWAFLPSTLLASAGIGLVGGVQGTVTIGWAYGVTLAGAYGVVLGLPIGLVTAVLRWLSQPGITRTTSSPASTLGLDRTAALLYLLAPAVASALAGAVADGLTDRGDLPVGPLQGLLFGLSTGIVMAGFRTASPLLAIAQVWLGARRRVPWRLMGFLAGLNRAEILRREGPFYRFRHEAVRDALGRVPQRGRAQAR